MYDSVIVYSKAAGGLQRWLAASIPSNGISNVNNKASFTRQNLFVALWRMLMVQGVKKLASSSGVGPSCQMVFAAAFSD